MEQKAKNLSYLRAQNQGAILKTLLLEKEVSKQDLSQRLKQYHPTLYAQVREVLDVNKQERHIRGGMATRKKYKGA